MIEDLIHIIGDNVVIYKITNKINGKISNSLTGHLCSNKTRKKMSLSHKNKTNIVILQYDKNNNFIKEWDSIMEASKKLKIWCIQGVCAGKRKSAGGYIWRIKNQRRII